MSDNYNDREEFYLASKDYESEDCGGIRKDSLFLKLWDLFWLIIGILTISVGKSPVFGIVIYLFSIIFRKLFF